MFRTPAVPSYPSAVRPNMPVSCQGLSSQHAVSAPSPSSLCGLHASTKWTHLVERGRLGRRSVLQPHTYECRGSSWIWYTGYHPPTSTWTSGGTLGPYFPYDHYNHSPNYYQVFWCHWTGTSLLRMIGFHFFSSNIYFSLVSFPYSPLVE